MFCLLFLVSSNLYNSFPTNTTLNRKTKLNKKRKLPILDFLNASLSDMSEFSRSLDSRLHENFYSKLTTCS